MMKNFDVAALGELLIDFTENGVSGQGNTLYEANPGGAPCNVLAMLNKLGRKTAFIGKVGQDIFGNRLKATLDEVGIDTSNLVMDEDVRTTLAFVETFPDGDRDFSFYRNPGADMMLREEELHDDLLADAKEQVAYGLSQCDILKISDNEIQWFTGEEDFDAGIAKLKAEYGIPLILLSMGRDGSRAYYKDLRVEAVPFLQENTIESTGAGDTFGGCCLHFLLEYGLDDLDEEKLSRMLTFANAAASIVTTRKGALRVMPEAQEVEGFIEERLGKGK